MKDSGEKEKTFDKFDKKLKKYISSASNAKAWSDLLPIMKDILTLLSRNKKDYDFHEITLVNRQILAKRLAQGLNPECPSGLHDVTLDVYEVLLKNIMDHHNKKLMDNLYLFAYGLFPFFPNATIQNKKKFLENILYPIFFNLNKEEFKLCLPGLLSSLIPGLDDNNDQTTKLIYKAFDDIISKNKGELERDFFGVYWMLLLRCQHLRSSGIKYLLEKSIKYADYIQLDEEKKKDKIEKQYPNLNITVINALCEIIKDKDIPTVRNGMDFIMTRIPLSQQNKLINDDAKINLIISALQLLIKNEYSTIRRLKSWILGINTAEDEVDYKSDDIIFKMGLVVKAFKIIFTSDKDLNAENLLNNIMIIKRLFESDEEFIKLIMPDVAHTIIKCIVNFWEKKLNCSENLDTENNNSDEKNSNNDNNNNGRNSNNDKKEKNDKNDKKEKNSGDDKNINNENIKNISVIKHFEELFKVNENCFECLWKSLADTIKELPKEEKSNNLFTKINELILPLRFSLIFIDIDSNDLRIKFFLPIISNLLNIIKNFPLKREDFKYFRKIVLITLAYIKIFQESKFHENDSIKDKNSNESRGSRNAHRSTIFGVINNEQEYEDNINVNVYDISEYSTLKYIKKNTDNDKILKNLNNSISDFQDFYVKILIEYLNIENELTKNEILLFRQFAEIIIRLQEYSEQEKEIPLWIKYLEKSVFNEKNSNLSNEAASIIIDLNLSSSLKSNIYYKIKNDYKLEKIDSDIIKQCHIEKYTKKMNIQPNCFELTLAKFYFLLNSQCKSEVIMELLYKIYYLDKNKFIWLINNTFNIKEDLIENIKLFSNFWKLANEYYPETKFFQRGECIFKIVDLLNDTNPLLRHLSKSWLNQINQDYKKIIDPIVTTLLDNQFLLQNMENNPELLNEFDSSKILDPFIKLKNIFLNCPLISKMTKLDQFEYLKTIVKCDNYLQALITITLTYMKIESSGKFNEKIKKDILTVKAASCEFLEFLLNVIEDKVFLDNNNKLINDTILFLLNISLKQNDEVMPTQLLDILKLLYFKYKSQTDNDKKRLLDLFKNDKLKKILINGMINDNFYIREHFISFTKTCVETFISIITIDDKEELEDFYNLCNEFIKPLSNSLCKGLKIDNKEEKEETESYSHYDKSNNKIIYKNYCEEYKEYKKYDESNALSILKGINDIITYCFKNEILEKSNKLVDSKENVSFLFIPLPFKKRLRTKFNFSGDWKEYKKELANNMKNNNPFLSFLSGLSTVIINYTDEKSNNEISNMSTDLCNNQISNLLNNFLLIWINQSDKYEIYDYCLNPKGILSSTQNDSWKIMSEDEIENILENIYRDQIKSDIRRISMNLFLTDSIKFMENLIGLWIADEVNENIAKDEKNVINDKQYKLSIIELLISMEIPLDVIIFCIGCIMQRQIYSKKDIYKKKDKVYETPFNISQNEAKILHFIYSYILLNPKKYTTKEKNEIENEMIEIWKEIINIVNIIMNNSKIIYSFCWIYEIMHLASEKYDIKSIDNKDIKNGAESIFNSITSKLMDAAFSDKIDCKYQRDNKLIVPFLPHTYNNLVKIIYTEDNLYQKNIEGTQINSKGKKKETNEQSCKKNLTLFLSKSDDLVQSISKRPKSMSGPIDLKENTATVELFNEINDFYYEYVLHLENDEKFKKNELNEIYRNLAMITLKENFYPLIKNLFDDNISIAKKYYTDIIIKILNIIKNIDESRFMISLANEFLVSLMEDTSKNIVLCGKNPLMDFIKSPSLFNRSLIELHGWKNIISKLTDNYPEILIDLIDDMGGKNIFVKKSEKTKMDTLRRISFVIYSCDKDKFIKDFGLIRRKAKELLSEDIENNYLEKEIFLIMRMFFLRFSHDCVMQMIRDLWPIIFIKLIQNILKNDPLLVTETFKFIELLSLVNIEEFSLYQWIFMVDTYDMNDLNINDQESLLNKILSHKNELFNPLSLEILGKGNITVSENILKGEQKGKSELYIAGDRDTLERKLKQFCYSIGDMNSYKVEANYDQIEKMIENDFKQKKISKNKIIL